MSISDSGMAFKRLLQWGVCASVLATGFAQAQTSVPARPRIPTLSCTTHPAIINTAIDGTNGYNNASTRVADSTAAAPTKDEHWDMVNSTIQYPTNVGFEYPKNWTGSSNGEPYQTTDPIGLGGKVIFNPQTDVDPAQWYGAPPYTDGAWKPSPFGNATWLGGGSLPRGTTFFRYEFDLDPSVDPSKFAWNFDYLADDAVRQIFVNGVRQVAPTAPTPAAESTVTSVGGYTNFASQILSQNWQPGRNTVIFQLWNWGQNPGDKSQSGMLIQAKGSSFCTTGIAVDKYVQTGSNFDPASMALYSGTATTNQNVYYNIAVSNTTTTALTGVTLQDPVANGLLATPYSWQCMSTTPVPSACTVTPVVAGDTTKITLPTIPAGGKIMLILSAQTKGSGLPAVITNTATAIPPSGQESLCPVVNGVNQCSSSASISTGPYISIQKTAPSAGPFVAGDAVTYQVKVVNEGSPNVTGITLTDPLQTTYLKDGTWSCTVPGDSFATCPTPANGTIDSSGNLQITDASSAVVPLPAFTIKGQSSLLFTIKGTVDTVPATPALTTATNTASVTSSMAGTQCWDGTATSALPCKSTADIKLLPNMSVTLDKTAVPADGSLVFEGSSLTYTVTVTNTGARDTSGTLADPWPGSPLSTPPAETCQMVVAGATSTPAACLGTHTLPAGAVLTYTATATVLAPSASTATFTNTATWTPDDLTHTTCNAVLGACQKAVTHIASNKPLLGITNTASPATNLVPGTGTTTYTIVVTNDGVVTVSDAKVLAGATTPANITPTSVTCTPADGATAVNPPSACPTGLTVSGKTITSNADGVLQPGGSYTLLVNATVDANAPFATSFVMPATVGTAQPQLLCSKGSLTGATPNATCLASAPVATSGPPVLSLTHGASPDTVAPGGTSTFTIVVKNTTGAPITDGVLTTDTPANLTLGTWDCAASGGAICVKSAVQTKAAGPLNLTGLNLPVGGSLTYTATGTLAATLKDGDSVTLNATLNSATTGATCTTGALPCLQPATVTVKVGAVAVTPVPVDAAWMLLALSSLLLAGAALRQRRQPSSRPTRQ